MNSDRSFQEPLLRLDDAGRRRPQNPTQGNPTQGWLFRNIELAIRGGDRWAIQGPSGSGKTVLLRTIAAFEPLDEGQLLWNEHPVPDDAVPQYRRHVIYLHQRPFFAEGTVAKNLMLPFRFAVHRNTAHPDRLFSDAMHSDPAARLATARRWLDALDRSSAMLDQDTRSLSGGESQLIALLRAIQLAPDVLLLDEPTASADREMVEQLEWVIMQWQRETKERAYLLVSHQDDQIHRMADRIFDLTAHAKSA